MRGRNAALYIIILALTAAAILFMMYQTRRIDANLYNSQMESGTEELIAELDQLDYEIYWIGELPQYMDGIADHVTLLSSSEANRNTLPVTEGDMGFTEYDEDGNVVNHIEQRDYASYMMIVVNTSEELSDVTLAAIQDCAVYNHVPVLLIGKNNIDAFRAYMILVAGDYDENSTMYFEISKYPQNNPIDPSVVASGGHAYADALLAFIRDSFDNASVVYVTPVPVVTTQTEQPEETVLTEETEDAA